MPYATNAAITHPLTGCLNATDQHGKDVICCCEGRVTKPGTPDRCFAGISATMAHSMTVFLILLSSTHLSRFSTTLLAPKEPIFGPRG